MQFCINCCENISLLEGAILDEAWIKLIPNAFAICNGGEEQC